MPFARLTALSIIAPLATIGLWLAMGDADPWRTTAVVLGAALIAWALRSPAVGAPGAGCQPPADRPGLAAGGLAAGARARSCDTRPERHERAGRLARDVRCTSPAGLPSRRHTPRRRTRR